MIAQRLKSPAQAGAPFGDCCLRLRHHGAFVRLDHLALDAYGAFIEIHVCAFESQQFAQPEVPPEADEHERTKMRSNRLRKCIDILDSKQWPFGTVGLSGAPYAARVPREGSVVNCGA
jgi:hypothetical protein